MTPMPAAATPRPGPAPGTAVPAPGTVGPSPGTVVPAAPMEEVRDRAERNRRARTSSQKIKSECSTRSWRRSQSC